MDLGLKDKVILITGGASGIGQSITRICLAEGARVVILGRISEGVDDFLAELSSVNARFEHITAELTDVAACRSAIEHIQHTYGELFGLINNAGVNDAVGLEHGSPDGFIESFRLNLLHVYALAHYALPLLKQSRGAIVNIASKVALTGQGGTSGYAAAKGGMLGLTREWAAELLPYSIRVNAVIPAEVMTINYRNWLAKFPDPEARLARITQQIPLERRMTHTDEIASTVAFLLSPTQSAHTTGQQLHVDGGYVHLDRMLTATPA